MWEQTSSPLKERDILWENDLQITIKMAQNTPCEQRGQGPTLLPLGPILFSPETKDNSGLSFNCKGQNKEDTINWTVRLVAVHFWCTKKPQGETEETC